MKRNIRKEIRMVIHPANTENVKEVQFDFAAEPPWFRTRLLVEGWNTGGKSLVRQTARLMVYDFHHSNPDFDSKYLNEYAHSKGGQY